MGVITATKALHLSKNSFTGRFEGTIVGVGSEIIIRNVEREKKQQMKI